MEKLKRELLRISKQILKKDKKLAFQLIKISTELQKFSGSEANLYE